VSIELLTIDETDTHSKG